MTTVALTIPGCAPGRLSAQGKSVAFQKKTCCRLEPQAGWTLEQAGERLIGLGVAAPMLLVAPIDTNSSADKIMLFVVMLLARKKAAPERTAAGS